MIHSEENNGTTEMAAINDKTDTHTYFSGSFDPIFFNFQEVSINHLYAMATAS